MSSDWVDNIRDVGAYGGSIRLDNGAGRRETLSVSSRADDPEFVNVAQHESAHAICALGMGWTVRYADALRGKTECLPPPGLSDAKHDWEFSVIAAAAQAFAASGDSGFSGDERAVGDLGQDWDAALKAARKLAADPDVRSLHTRLTAALVVNGRIESDELQRLWDD